jgi:hypothetical protein
MAMAVAESVTLSSEAVRVSVASVLTTRSLAAKGAKP